MSLVDWDFIHVGGGQVPNSSELGLKEQGAHSPLAAPQVQATALSSSDGVDQALGKRLKEGTSQLGPVGCCDVPAEAGYPQPRAPAAP